MRVRSGIQQRIGLVAIVVTASLCAAASAQAGPKGFTWQGHPKGWDRVQTVVAAGSIWQLFQRGQQIQVQSRTLTGGKTRGWKATFPRSLDRVPGFTPLPDGSYFDSASNGPRTPQAVSIAVEGGTAFVGSQWCLPADYASPCNAVGITSYRANDGAQLSFLPKAQGYLIGSPLVLVKPTGTPTADSVALSDPTTGVAFPWTGHDADTPGTAPYTRIGGVIGRWLASVTYTAPSASSPGEYEIVDYRTGQVAYRMTSRQLLSATQGNVLEGNLTTILARDGGLGVRAQTGDAGPGLQPFDVDPQGRVRRVGRRLAHATDVTVTRNHGRLFVSVGGRVRTRAGKHRDCGGTWMTNATGTRGLQLRARVLPTWDGKTAVFDETARGQPGGKFDRVVIRHRLARLTLRSSQVPRC